MSDSTSIRLSTDQRDQLRSVQELLVYENVQPGNRVHVDHEDPSNQPSAGDTVEYLCSLHDALFEIEKQNEYNGRILGYLQHMFDQCSEEDYSFDLDQWKRLKGDDGAEVLFARYPGAHGWQVAEDEDGTKRLDSAADPTDLSLVVFDNGYILDGGLEPKLVHDPDAVETIRNFVGHRDEKAAGVDETLLSLDP